MIEAYGNIWDHANEYDAIVITTNGFVKKNGEAVMGRGIALEAKERFPFLPKKLGYYLNEVGNFPYAFTPRDLGTDYWLVTFPVKPEYGPNGIPGWRAKADPDLIRLSAQSIARLIDLEYYSDVHKILMPRPGCGNGGLKWEVVKPILEPILDDRFTVMEINLDG